MYYVTTSDSSKLCHPLYIDSKRQDLLEYFELAVPVFHAYGHKMDCQVTCVMSLSMSKLMLECLGYLMFITVMQQSSVQAWFWMH